MSDVIYLCSECGNCFASETSLQEHDLAVHSQNHVCLVCLKGFNNPTLLKRHMTAHQNLLHCCNICGELCENKFDVYVHVTSSHKYEGRIVCDLCRKIFSTGSGLKVHCMNRHAEAMTQVLQKWELFCNVHSSRNLCREDVLKDTSYSFDCPLHPGEKESQDKTTNGERSRSISLTETMEDPWRPTNGGSARLAATELQTFLQDLGDKESWYTKNTDHLSSSMRPSDILDRVQPLTTKNKSQPQKEQSIRCRLCDMTFNDRNDYMLAHGCETPSDVYPHKHEEKSSTQTGFQGLMQLRMDVIRNKPLAPSEKCIEEVSGIKSVVIQEDANAENQNGQLQPNGNLLTEISALTSQIQNLNPSEESQKDQFSPNGGTSLPEISTMIVQNLNENAKDGKLE